MGNIMKTILLHGLNSTGSTFNYITSSYDSDFHVIEYDSFCGISDILQFVKKQLPNTPFKVRFKLNRVK
jgi:hypothetical protein